MLGDLPAHFTGQCCALFEGNIGEWNKGQHIECPVSRMNAAVLPQINQLYGDLGCGEGGGSYRFRGADECHDQPVMVGICAPIGQPYPWRPVHGINNRGDDDRIPALAEVRYALYQWGHFFAGPGAGAKSGSLYSNVSRCRG